ncbi:D-2-hydroxyacid dehydrogenase [Wielerella bovis]|uniref:D-2-hydroxyacid dehydrogenase n=1 Tax=Wielerella bovis TaxID=2917790 RepID=UPI002018BDF0|nr:D-2-hydroxyacid dehydrogenase [Wielerella bovis]ULJ60351.1 D-2-hydroxyacid dehydrogenase [Wielerella bovis]
MKIAFLDRAGLRSRPIQFNFPCEYIEYPLTAPEQILERMQDVDILLVSKVVITAEHIAANPQLKLIAVTATGYNNIDVAAAKTAGVSVCNVRAYGNDSVAEHAFLLMLALARNLPAYMRDVSAGMWQKSPTYCHYGAPLRDLRGKALAIFGRGNIGGRLGELASAFGMNVMWGEHKHAHTVREGYTEFQAALKQADAISLHCPLNEYTRNMIGEAELKMMKPNAILINVGRGGLADEQAVIAALKYGQLGGAGFDVLTTEPPREGNPLLTSLPNLIVTPHMAWASEEAIENLVSGVEDNVNQFVAGTPQNIL